MMMMGGGQGGYFIAVQKLDGREHYCHHHCQLHRMTLTNPSPIPKGAWGSHSKPSSLASSKAKSEGMSLSDGSFLIEQFVLLIR